MFSPRCCLLLILVALISACAAPPPPPVKIHSEQHQQALASLNSWRISGKMAFKSTEKKFSANMNWHQQQTEYNFKLTSFLGSTLLAMQGSPGSVKLSMDDQEYQDVNASRLLSRITGWNIPVNQFPDWVKGLSQPRDQVVYDDLGLIQTLLPGCYGCGMWQIQYSQYKSQDGVWLPHSITLTNIEQPTNQIKLRISQWKTI